MGNGRVQVAYLHAHQVSHSWHESMQRLVAFDAATTQRIISTDGPFMIRADSGGLVEGRNLGVTRFLDETDHEWLWWIDTDMGFLPDTVERLVAAASEDRLVIGGLCFALREVEYDGYGGRRVLPVPTLYTWAQTPEGHQGFSTRLTYPRDQVISVAGTGAACLLLHRTILEEVRAVYGDTWFDQIRYGDGRLVSEDLSLCYRIAQVNRSVHVHTGVRTTHHKMVWLGEPDYPGAPAAGPIVRERAEVAA